VALVFVPVLARACPREDTSTSPHSVPRAIVVRDWLVVPRAAGVDEGRLLTRFALDPDAPMPTTEPVASSSDSNPGWHSTRGDEAKDVSIAFTTIESNADDVRMAQLIGAELLVVNGECFIGDVDRLGFRGAPVLLRKGSNRVFVATIRGSFSLHFWKPEHPIVIGTWDTAWPGYGVPYGVFAEFDVTYPVFNASMERIESLHVTYGHAVPAECPRLLRRDRWLDGGGLAPLGMLLGRHEWELGDGWIDPQCPRTSSTRFEDSSVALGAGTGAPSVLETLRRDLSARRELDDRFRPRDAPQRRKSLIARCYRPCALVYGTRGTDEETRALLAQARQDQQWAWARTRGTPLLLSDEEWLSARGTSRRDERNSVSAVHVADTRVVLYGNADTNAAWATVVPPDAALRVLRSAVKKGDAVLEGDDLFGWMVCSKPGTPSDQYDAVVFSTGPRGARAGSLLHPFLRGIEPIEDALFRRDEDAPQGRRALSFPGR
jgi:hypothetical protein